jgi:mono/diheme cytochrome c family protein
MVRQGGIQMPSFSDALTDEQIQAVAEYVAGTLADPASHAADVGRGGELYRLYCAGCHSATGRGGALTTGPNAPDISQFPAAESLAAMILGRREMPAFAGNTFDVTQQTSVALYVDELIEPASPGGAGLWYLGPVPEGAVGAIGLLILIFLGVWLAWKSLTAAPCARPTRARRCPARRRTSRRMAARRCRSQAGPWPSASWSPSPAASASRSPSSSAPAISGSAVASRRRSSASAGRWPTGAATWPATR